MNHWSNRHQIAKWKKTDVIISRDMEELQEFIQRLYPSSCVYDLVPFGALAYKARLTTTDKFDLELLLLVKPEGETLRVTEIGCMELRR